MPIRKTLWKVSGSTVGTIGGLGGTDSANTVYAAPSALYAAGQKNNKPVIWKIEGNNAAVYKELSTQDGFVVALYAFGAGLFAAGTSEDKPAWWYIAPDLTVTQTVISDSSSGEIRDILVTAQ